MKKILVSTIFKIFSYTLKICIVLILIVGIYFESKELNELKMKNKKTMELIEQKREEINLLKQIIILYQEPEFLFSYVVRKYGLLDNKKYDLYILEVNNCVKKTK